MANEFSHELVIKRTGNKMGMTPERIQTILDTYADEYVKHARETDPSLIQPIPPVRTEPTPAKARKATPAKATSKPARKATTPRKAAAKATTPKVNGETAQGSSEGNALIDAQLRREAEASVALDRDQTHVVG